MPSHLALLLALFPSPTPGPQDDPLPPETVVTAPRSGDRATDAGAHVTVVGGEDLARTGESSLPRAIGRAAGIWIQETNLGGGSPFLRGLVGNQVLIVVDGVRINDSTTRSGPNQSLNTIDPAIVQEVRIIRGPSSVLYGSDAIGGVVLIRTLRRLPTMLAPGGEQGFDAEVMGLYGSQVRGGRLSLNGSWANETDGFLAIGSIFDYRDLDTGDGRTARFTGYGGGGLFGNWTHAFDPLRSLEVTARSHRDDDVPRTDKMNAGYGQTNPSHELFLYSRQQRDGLLATYTDGRGGSVADRFQARLSLRRYVEEREEQQWSSADLSLERDEVQTVGLGLDFQSALGAEHLLTWGLDVDHDRVDSTKQVLDTGTGGSTPANGDFAPDARYTGMGLFVQDEIFAFDPVDVTLGLRYSWFDFSFGAFPGVDGSTDESGHFGALTGSLQVAGNLTDSSRLSGTLAQGFRAPNLDELAKNEGDFALGQELASPYLQPEESLTGELALDVVKPGWNLGAAAYYTAIDDLIGRSYVGDAGGTAQFERDNVGSAAIWGFEALGRTRLGGPDAAFGVEASLAFARGRQYDLVDETGQPHDVDFRRIPPLHGRAALFWDPSEHPAALDWAQLELVFADRQDKLHPQDLADPRIDPSGTAGWAILNLSFSGPFSPLGERSRWSIDLINLFDKGYRVHGSGFDGPGRGVALGLSWRP